MDLTKPIICEYDPVKNSVCIECFSSKTKMWFYNSQGPFCGKKCFCDFVGITLSAAPELLQLERNVKGYEKDIER